MGGLLLGDISHKHTPTFLHHEKHASNCIKSLSVS